MTYEKTKQLYERAITGDWRDWPLDSIGGTLLLMGLTHEEAVQMLDDIAAARQERFTQRMRIAGLTAGDIPLAPYSVVKWVANEGPMPKRLEAFLHAYEAAQETLPAEAHERLELARQLVVRGAVKLQDNGAVVTTSGTAYQVNGYNCNCPDDAPYLGQHKLCPHKLAYWLLKKVQEPRRHSE